MQESNKWIYSWNSVHITPAVIFYCTKQVKAMRLRCCTAHCNTHMPTGPGTDVLTHTLLIRWSEPMHQSKGTPMCRKSVWAWLQSDTVNTTAQYIKRMATKGYALILTSYVFPQRTIVLYSMWRSHFKQQHEVFCTLVEVETVPLQQLMETLYAEAYELVYPHASNFTRDCILWNSEWH